MRGSATVVVCKKPTGFLFSFLYTWWVLHTLTWYHTSLRTDGPQATSSVFNLPRCPLRMVRKVGKKNRHKGLGIDQLSPPSLTGDHPAAL